MKTRPHHFPPKLDTVEAIEKRNIISPLNSAFKQKILNQKVITLSKQCNEAFSLVISVAVAYHLGELFLEHQIHPNTKKKYGCK